MPTFELFKKDTNNSEVVKTTKTSESGTISATGSYNDDSEQQQEPIVTLQSVLPKYEGITSNPFKPRFMLKLNLLLLMVCLSSSTMGYSSVLMNALQGFTEWNNYMGNPQGAVLGAINSYMFFGTLLSFSCASQLSDKLGRQRSMLLANFILFVGCGLQAGAVNYSMFLIGGIIIGLANGITMVAGPTLISELSYPKFRQIMTTSFNTCWFFGGIFGGWICYGCKNIHGSWTWRTPTLCAVILPGIVTCVLLLGLITESPRWLVSVGLEDKAQAILIKYHAGGNVDVGGPLVEFEMAEIRRNIEAEKIANKFSYCDLFKTPANRKRMFILTWLSTVMQMSGNSLITYYLNKVLDSIGMTALDQKLLVNVGIQIYNYFISITVAFTVGRFKRKTMFLTSLTIMLITYITLTILSAINQNTNFQNKSLGKGVLSMLFLFSLGYDVGYNSVPYLYITEVFPFTTRTKGVNISMLVQQVW
ncbi:unnamed protein product [Ambrosiozyma monospora]|uniref:Unnamed protein product n=1 Tax=Ambrosiozyma monospora TaxID=43982 RepID=A0ACB5SVK5_AMBMO|nr:unnamed protein product [Ambrosiozyma monospora]